MTKYAPKRILPLLMLMTLLFQTTHLYALEVKAPSAILMDANTGEILYEKNANTKRAMASTSKIMTYLLTMEAIDDGRIALNNRVKVSKNAAQTQGSSYKLKENDILTVSELLSAMMIISANDSAVVLAEHISGSVYAFVREMNNKAKSLGLTSAYFVNPNGMPLANKDQNKISAKDLALLSKHTIHYYGDQLIRMTSQKQFEGVYKTYSKKNTNQLLTTTPFTDGLKTGYTDLAMHCLVSTAKANDPKNTRLISVILGGQSSAQRFADSKKMLEYGLHSFEPPKSNIAVFVNGDQIICEPTNPFIKNQTTLVPLVKIADQLGGKITWDSATKTVTGENDFTHFTLTIDKTQATINGNIIDLATAPVIVEGTTMVPLKFIAQSLGMDVEWESASRTVKISSKEIRAALARPLFCRQ